MSESSVESYQRLLARERKARKEAERLLEAKSLELYNANEQLKKQTEELDARVKERTKQFKDAKAKAENAAKVKSDFLANMSHEIRTPLNAIIGMNNLLSEEALSSRQEEFVHSIHDSSEVLLRIINDILDFSKIAEGKLDIVVLEFSLIDVVDKVFELLRIKAINKGIDFLMVLDPDIPSQLMGDSSRLQQVLLNLIDNAIKFTSEGHVTLRLKCLYKDLDSCMIQFDVEDTGIGMSQSHLNTVFSPFTQANIDISRNYGGTGLGLVIAQKIVELMGGTISVTSKEQFGTTFTVCVPFDLCSESRTADDLNSLKSGTRFLITDKLGLIGESVDSILRNRGVHPYSDSSLTESINKLKHDFQNDPCLWILVHDSLTDDEKNDMLLFASTKPKNVKVLLLAKSQKQFSDFGQEDVGAILLPVSAKSLWRGVVGQLGGDEGEPEFSSNQSTDQEEDFSTLRILLAEDNPINQTVCRELLLLLGIQVDIASNGIEVLQMIELFEYDLILMDIQMPEMSGVEACQKIRASGNSIPIVALTANVMKEDQEKYKEAGMNDFLGKPLIKKELVDAISKLFPQSSGVSDIPDSSRASYVEDNVEVLDYKTLVKSLGGQKDFVIKILDEFSKQTDRLIGEAKSQMDDNHFQEAKSIYHRIAGSSYSVRVNVLGQIASSLESLLKIDKPSLEEVSKLMDELDLAYARFTEMMPETKESVLIDARDKRVCSNV